MAKKGSSSHFEEGRKMFGVIHQQNGSLVVEVTLKDRLGKRWSCTEYSRVSIRDGKAHYITWDLTEDELFEDRDEAIEFALANAPKHQNNQKAKKN